jgi:hypothetical protein
MTREEIHKLPWKAQEYINELQRKLTLTDVVSTLPSVKSKEFKRWTQSKGYEPAFNGLWYEKNNQTYSTDLLYRAFTNEIEFGN